MIKRDITSSYDIALSGLRRGDPIDKYEGLIKKHQEKQEYEHCAGIRKAIDRFKKYKK